jgi:hypothetical protein
MTISFRRAAASSPGCRPNGDVHGETWLAGADWWRELGPVERRKVVERADEAGVPGIGRVFVGHTVQTGGPRRYGNVYAIDTGAVYGLMGMGGHLTCVNIDAPTDGIEMERVAMHGVAAVDLPAPGRPFGSYARPGRRCTNAGRARTRSRPARRRTP